MKLLIKTQKPEEIEKELILSIEHIKKGYKPSRKLRFFMRMARIDVNMFKESIYAEYKRIDDNSFEFLVNYPNIEHTKHFLVNNLNKELKKIDDSIDVSEINEKTDNIEKI